MTERKITAPYCIDTHTCMHTHTFSLTINPNDWMAQKEKVDVKYTTEGKSHLLHEALGLFLLNASHVVEGVS